MLVMIDRYTSAAIFATRFASTQKSLLGFSSVMEGVEKSKLRSGINPLNAVAADDAAARTYGSDEMRRADPGPITTSWQVSESPNAAWF